MIFELPYPDSVFDLFERISDLPWPVLLDGFGSCDILCAAPFATLVTKGENTEISDGYRVTLSKENPFDLVRKRLHPPSRASDLPFAGGAIGYFGYDLGHALHDIPSGKGDSGIPDLAVGIYDWAVIVDHAKRTAHLASGFRDPKTPGIWDELKARLALPAKRHPGNTFRLKAALEVSPNFEEYALAFEKIKHYIASGDCYQVNLAQQFEAPFEGDPWVLYRNLRKSSHTPFSAFLSNPCCQVLSASPERFLKVDRGFVETKPIKGTRPRAIDPGEDESLANALRTSDKDRAENLMIVDLLRNDLGKVCETGSVRVEKLFEIEHYASVHHLVSTITAKLDAKHDAVSLLQSAFPGGSVTGAPKIRAMQIIEELEPFRRGLYCGAIARIGFEGNMESSIAIRTMVASGGRIRLWAGGGIVADSRLEAEYQEIRDKAKVLLGLVESTLPSC